MDWPHSPPHRYYAPGSYFITAGTYLKVHHFRTRSRLDFLTETLHERAKFHGVQLPAWIVFSNHYHLIARSDDPAEIAKMISRFHTYTSQVVNGLDQTPGRKVWYRHRETELTSEKAYWTRFRYVRDNAVRHGIRTKASDYKWSFVRQFELTAPMPVQHTVESFKIDLLKIDDEFEPIIETDD